MLAGVPSPRVPGIPDRRVLVDAAQILDGGTRVAILVDQGARAASRRVVELAEVLGAGIAKTPLGRSVLPDSLPYVTGCIGLLGSHASRVMLSTCDTLLRVGTLFPYAGWMPPVDQARLVEIDADPYLVGSGNLADVHLVGDAEGILLALLALVERKRDRAWRARIEHEVATGRAMGGTSPVQRADGVATWTEVPQITAGQDGTGRAVEPASLWRIMASMVPGPHHQTYH